MRLNEFKQEDGSYILPDGINYDCFTDAVNTGIFGFCGCGMPDDVVEFVGKVLRFLKDGWSSEGQAKLFTEDGSAYFFYYVLDLAEITEHGGSVPGWLTEKGEDLLLDIEEFLESQNAQENEQ